MTSYLFTALFGGGGNQPPSGSAFVTAFNVATASTEFVTAFNVATGFTERVTSRIS